MRQGLRDNLTYANVIATLALFFALGGGAYAAITLPKNSVGTKQIKPNAVNGSKIANGSLRAQDFAPRDLYTGAPGPTGTQGAPGPKGDTGTPGLDGAAIAVRARSTSSVETPADHSQITVPLSSATWTQGAAEIDLGPYGRITYTAPGAASCGDSVALLWEVDVDGKSFASGRISSLPDGVTHTANLGGTGYMFEPGAAQEHVATAKVSSVCEAGDFPAPFTVSDLRFDVIRTS